MIPPGRPAFPGGGIMPDRVPVLDGPGHKVILLQYRLAPSYTLYMVELWLPGIGPSPVLSRLTQGEWRELADALGTIECMLSLTD